MSGQGHNLAWHRWRLRRILTAHSIKNSGLHALIELANAHDFPQSFSADCVESIVEIHKGGKRSQCCSIHFSWRWRAVNNMSTVPWPAWKKHWLSGRRPYSRWWRRRLSSTRAKTLPAMERREIPRWLSQECRFPLLWYMWRLWTLGGVALCPGGTERGGWSGQAGHGHQPCTPRLDKANGLTKLVESVGVEVTLGFLMARSRVNHVCYLGVQKKRMGCRELFWSRRECKLCCVILSAVAIFVHYVKSSSLKITWFSYFSQFSQAIIFSDVDSLT